MNVSTPNEWACGPSLKEKGKGKGQKTRNKIASKHVSVSRPYIACFCVVYTGNALLLMYPVLTQHVYTARQIGAPQECLPSSDNDSPAGCFVLPTAAAQILQV